MTPNERLIAQKIGCKLQVLLLRAKPGKEKAPQGGLFRLNALNYSSVLRQL